MTYRTSRTRQISTALAVLLTSPALATVTAGPAAAGVHHTFHVDCSRAQDGNGTNGRPWNTLAAVNSTVFAPGDQILFKRGTACHGALTPQGSGSARAPITVGAYGTGVQPLIAGDGVPAAVYLHNVEYWELADLEVTNHGPTVANRRGVQVELSDFGTGHHYRLTNLTVHDVNGDNTKDSHGSSGIHLDVAGSAKPTAFDDVEIDGNTVYTVDRTGIELSSDWWCRKEVNCDPAWGWGNSYTPWTGVVVQNNTVHDIGGDGIVMQYTKGGLNQYNTAYDINMRSGLNNAGIWVWNADNVTFQFNEAYRVRRPAGTDDGEAFDVDYGTDGTTYQYNYSHDNEGGFLLYCGGCGGGTSSGKNSVVRYNVSQNDGTRVIAAAGATNASFYNNSIYLPAGSTTAVVEELWPKGTTHLTLANNIIDNLGTGGFLMADTSKTNYSWTHNLLAGNHPADEPADPYKITADPLFSAPGTGPAGYRLQAGSPALAAGLPIAGNGGRDYAGNRVPAGCTPDIGAFQITDCG
ncbi:right-handed parallel beta-helix repeat-containing protein [Kitasatospora herbaricolor]|uniref:right-handed parallel beta-helix repeat-containing protein n=1 Tax=Kitasatospora herbaricolor TaxID=68217 RepID=UPI0036D9AD5F